MALFNFCCRRLLLPFTWTPEAVMRVPFVAAWIVGASMLLSPWLSGCALDGLPNEGEGEGEGEKLPGSCDAAVDVPCRDDVFSSLSMSLDEVAVNALTNEPDGNGFATLVDARSNGAFASGPWVYARFSATGLEQLPLLDDDSLNSLDWDIAFQRFTIRLNSGFGGPSCVTAARTGVNTDFDTLDAVPTGLTFNDEEFMSDNGDDSCTIIPDGSGQGSPGVVLQSWWTYPGCVATTGNVFVLSLQDGRQVKLLVTQYYGQGQELCNDGTRGESQSALVRIRWAFLG